MKIFFSTLAGFIVLVILAGVVVGFIFWSRVPDIVANHLSKKMKVAVDIDSFGLGWGKIDVKKIQIGNPPNSLLVRAFACSEVNVLAPFTNYLDKNIVIDEIDVKDVYLGLEFDSATGTTGNWTRIMGNLEQSMGSPSNTSSGKSSRKKGKKQQQPAPSASERTVLIHRLVLTNIQCDVVYRDGNGKVKRLPTIDRMELTEISSEGGLPMDQILNSVLGQMLKQVFIQQNLKNMMQGLMNTPSPVQQYLAPFKGLFNAVPQEPDEDAIGA
jgi:hypothetical protein